MRFSGATPRRAVEAEADADADADAAAAAAAAAAEATARRAEQVVDEPTAREGRRAPHPRTAVGGWREWRLHHVAAPCMVQVYACL